MRQLTVSRRQFGQGLGASLALAGTGQAALAHAGTHELEVRIVDFAFAPNPLEVIAGDTVVWVNKDLAPHTATAMDGSWDTDLIEGGQTARLTFETPGTFDYFCIYHPHMTGSISVRAKETA